MIKLIYLLRVSLLKDCGTRIREVFYVLPRPEHPRRDLYRQNWLTLNGYWDFRFDFGKSGFEENAPKGLGFDRKIIVPTICSRKRTVRYSLYRIYAQCLV